MGLCLFFIVNPKPEPIRVHIKTLSNFNTINPNDKIQHPSFLGTDLKSVPTGGGQGEEAQSPKSKVVTSLKFFDIGVLDLI
ncbi:MAG: hypothetical protein A3D30_03115 [Deltaproteobacteria bacterium RIFCSPHIGHO2_02_FULL_43_33]|nr:MAG: hypothetical protein A3D30_03115 [Deltaproteobacteria bacterium RIFCSPHIGHO2_02_FULL_43_33]